jgi:hypothetical protein
MSSSPPYFDELLAGKPPSEIPPEAIPNILLRLNALRGETLSRIRRIDSLINQSALQVDPKSIEKVHPQLSRLEARRSELISRRAELESEFNDWLQREQQSRKYFRSPAKESQSGGTKKSKKKVITEDDRLERLKAKRRDPKIETLNRMIDLITREIEQFRDRIKQGV